MQLDKLQADQKVILYGSRFLDFAEAFLIEKNFQSLRREEEIDRYLNVYLNKPISQKTTKLSLLLS